MIFTQEAPLTRKRFLGRSCTRSKWNLEKMVFEERRKAEKPEKNLSKQREEPTTNLTLAGTHDPEPTTLLCSWRFHKPIYFKIEFPANETPTGAR